MITYMILYTFYSFSLICENFLSYKNRENLLKLLLIITVFFIGLRYKLGSDWLSYQTGYDLSVGIKQNNFFNEGLFYLLRDVLKMIGIKFELWVLIITVINFIFFKSFINNFIKQDKILFFCLFLNFYMLKDFDLLRQSMAFYICLYNLKNINSKKKYFIINLIAVLFHKTSILFSLYYFFNKVIKINKKNTIIISLLYFFTVFFKINFIKILIKLITQISYFKKYVYLDNLYKERFFGVNFILIFISICMLCFLKQNNYTEKITKFVYFYILTITLTAGNIMIQLRMAYYFVFAVPLLWTAFYGQLKGNIIKIIYKILMILYLYLSLFYLYNNLAIRLSFFPYKNYLFKNFYNEDEIIKKYNKMQELGEKIYNK